MLMWYEACFSLHSTLSTHLTFWWVSKCTRRLYWLLSCLWHMKQVAYSFELDVFGGIPTEAIVLSNSEIRPSLGIYWGVCSWLSNSVIFCILLSSAIKCAKLEYGDDFSNIADVGEWAIPVTLLMSMQFRFDEPLLSCSAIWSIFFVSVVFVFLASTPFRLPFSSM